MFSSPLVSRWCFIHAVLLVGALPLGGWAFGHDWISSPAGRGISLILWVVGVLCWPLWYVVLHRANADDKSAVNTFLAAGTTLWGICLLPIIIYLVFALMWQGM